MKIEEISNILDELRDEIKKKDDEIYDLKEELDELEGHDCDCEEEVHDAIVDNEKLPCNSMEDERKIDLLSANWEYLTYDKLYEILNNNIPNMLPPRI